MRKTLQFCAVAAMGLIVSEPAAARVQDETESGFVVQLGVDVPASPEDVWEMLVHPEQWWDDATTFSGDAANLTLKPVAGGCFCEELPATDAPKGTPPGGAEYMRVIYVEPPRALRLTGALGPLQPDPVNGVLTMVLQKTETGTRIMWEYAVSGHLRKPGMATAMDTVLTGQLVGLGEKLGVRLAPRKQPDGKGEAAEAPEDDAEEEAKAVKAAEDDSDEAGDKADGDEDDGVEAEQSGHGEETAELAKSAKGKRGKSEPVSNDVEADSDEAEQPKDAKDEADSSEDEAEPAKPAKDAGKSPIIGR